MRLKTKCIPSNHCFAFQINFVENISPNLKSYHLSLLKHSQQRRFQDITKCTKQKILSISLGEKHSFEIIKTYFHVKIGQFSFVKCQNGTMKYTMYKWGSMKDEVSTWLVL